MKKNYGTFTFIQRILQTPKKKRTEIHKNCTKGISKVNRNVILESQ
jgi:hypothetical protein